MKKKCLKNCNQMLKKLDNRLSVPKSNTVQQLYNNEKYTQ